MHKNCVANALAGDRTFGALSRSVSGDGRVNLHQQTADPMLQLSIRREPVSSGHCRHSEKGIIGDCFVPGGNHSVPHKVSCRHYGGHQ